MTYHEVCKVGSSYYLKRRWREHGKLRAEVLARYGPKRPTFFEPKILLGDSRKVVHELPQGSVHLVVTSPPYYHLKEGDWGGYSGYVDMLNGVWKECIIALDNGCRLCVNVGDPYTSTKEFGKNKAFPIHADVIKGADSLGFDYMGTIIWRKGSTIRPNGGCHMMGSWASGYPRESLQAFSGHEFIVVLKKPGSAKRTPTEAQKKASWIPRRDRNAWYDPLWCFNGERKTLHSAPFPLELPYRLIRMFSFVGDTVLDPFMGSGTTLLAALQFAWQGIGIDISESCVEVSRKRLEPHRRLWERRNMNEGGDAPGSHVP